MKTRQLKNILRQLIGKRSLKIHMHQKTVNLHFEIENKQMFDFYPLAEVILVKIKLTES